VVRCLALGAELLIAAVTLATGRLARGGVVEGTADLGVSTSLLEEDRAARMDAFAIGGDGLGSLLGHTHVLAVGARVVITRSRALGLLQSLLGLLKLGDV